MSNEKLSDLLRTDLRKYLLHALKIITVQYIRGFKPALSRNPYPVNKVGYAFQ